MDSEEWKIKAREAGIKWLAPVESAHTPTDARCLDCGHRWKALPSSVLEGWPVCPACKSGEMSSLSPSTQAE